jgi:adenylate kinase
MIVVITGAPGAGKGTQASLIEEKLGYHKFSTGDALRKHVQQGTKVGKVAGGLMADGKLVPDDVLFEILKEELGDEESSKILLDGYPRNVNQARTLDTLKRVHPVKIAVHLRVPREELIERLSGRRVCSKCSRTFHVKFSPPSKADICDACGSALVQRPDDKPEKVAVRLQVYEQDTKPVLDFYKAQDLYREIDGNQDQGTVFKELSGIISGLN